MPSLSQIGAVVALTLYAIYCLGFWREGLETQGSATLRIVDGALSVLIVAVLVAVAGGWT